MKLNKSLRVTAVFTLATILCFTAAFLVATSVFAQKDKITFDVPFGKVNFTHKNHFDRVKIECMKCHHTWKAGEYPWND